MGGWGLGVRGGREVAPSTPLNDCLEAPVLVCAPVRAEARMVRSFRSVRGPLSARKILQIREVVDYCQMIIILVYINVR